MTEQTTLMPEASFGEGAFGIDPERSGRSLDGQSGVSQAEPLYEIWGGSLDSPSFYDGGPAGHLEDCVTLADAASAVSEWQGQNYAAWIQDKETGDVISGLRALGCGRVEAGVS